MNTLRIAWRNIWRNKRRTGITVSAVALNTAVLIMTYALMEGIMVQMMNNVTQVVVGDAQVHGEGYLKDRSIYKSVPQPEAVMASAKAAGIDAAARTYGFGLISSGTKSAGATFWGVHPAAEKQAFQLATKMLEGNFVSETPDRGMVLGRRLAKSLNVDVGDEVVTLVQAADGSLGNELFTVSGILQSVGDDVDRGAALIHAKDFGGLFLTGERVHEIAFNSRGALESEAVVSAINVTDEKAETKTWQQLLPMFSDMVNLSAGSTWIFAVVFFLAAAFGVLNTMLMATHDRVREYGVLKALGATPWRIIRDVAAEGLMLALVSTVIGTALGIVGSWYLQVHGIDLSGADSDMSFGGVAFDPVWRASFKAEFVTQSVVPMWLICVVASLYPAVKAARLDAARAMTNV